MINAPQLLSDLTKLLKRLEVDLLERIEQTPELKASLQTEWQAACDADRCAETFETWADQIITQAGVHWLLSCVFLRFIEDNQLVDRPWLGGTPESGRLALVRDRHEAYFRANPLENDRDYLLAAFREAGTLPGLHTFFDEAHNPVFRLGISGDAAMALRQFWQQVDPSTGLLVHDFTDPSWNTRFLGDLYQDLSEATRKRYALLQTPEFVEEFILDRTLTPAIREFGYREVRMIDPTCGSGHFLLGGFYRMLAEWQRNEPGRNPVDLAQKALDAVAGVDLNPFAVAISRFRLFVAALQASGVQRLVNAHDFKVHVAIGDSLLHGTRFGLTQSQELFDAAESHADTGLAHAYASEDLAEVQRILGRQYHAVVGNPPYIVVKDAALNVAYRNKYASCHMKYSLGAPFTERFFDLAVTGVNGGGAGYVGLITANSFMKREFGSKLIEQVLPRLDLTHVVDTSGAYIPGHGTPTVILLGRHRSPVDEVVRTVMGIKGEPSTPENPANGLVWSAIVDQIDRVGSESDFVSVADTLRVTLSLHPWTVGGGGAADLKVLIEEGASCTLDALVDVCRLTVMAGNRLVTREVRELGVFGMTNADEAMFAPEAAFRRQGVEPKFIRSLVVGDGIRDWSIAPSEAALFPYDGEQVVQLEQAPGLARWLWACRTVLGNRATFSKKTYFDEGRPWWEWHQIALRRLNTPLTITVSFVATHNHFVLDRGGSVFNRSAPVLKLPANVSEADHLGLLGILNSSTACFWCQQVMHNKGGPGGGSSKDEKWHDFFEFASTALAELPLPAERPSRIAREIDVIANTLAALHPARVLRAAVSSGQSPQSMLNDARDTTSSLRRRMVALQEELDWQSYHLFGVLPANIDAACLTYLEPPEVDRGERAFEIVLARRLKDGKLETRWFEWLGITPTTEIPQRWPAIYREVVQRRIDLIERDRNIGLVENMGCKRRWEWPTWNDLESVALRDWLLDRLEAPELWPAGAEQPPQVTSTSRLAEAVMRDTGFMQIAALYAGHADFDALQLVTELVSSEAVPALPVQRYTDTGLRKRAQWEDTWALQRREDAGENVGKIPVPPKYQSKDFLKADFWRLRGGLDVPKERWVSYPGCERGSDGSLVIAWAGWNHLQQATAVAGYYMDMKDSEGWEPARLQPLLASLLELVPWLEQWHNELDPVFGERMGDYYRGFVTEEARGLGFTLDDLRAWKPVTVAAKRGRKKKA
ncbi:BREX-2 system adenine-specific DNA-methyltransferase PglX [Diaphorobacter sp. J5-51]|uniref:BREX-2 system adenine-specific DNA-methyltransferase PglX n=1 Tax=Diaphorobacter sp. J5-51 TaxID=680496 RepID=UPI0006436F0B|nr:BREX-2 system adenine-specific DNA-methyltransferase PglX [Diaphorobacter sp. J5-51]KLR57105.1 hypothetical protein OX89_14210 [Diaphorobacter sp. J5-51]